MTSLALHRRPRWNAVAAAQLRDTALALRKEGIGFVALWIVFFAMSVRAAYQSVAIGKTLVRIEYGAEAGLPMVTLALLIPFGVWRGEDPARRTYHWAMPVPRGRHTLVKIAAGFVWLLVAVAGYVFFWATLSWAVHSIGGSFTSSPNAGRIPTWEWLVPFGGSTIAYLFGSAIVVGLRHPWRWLIGCVPTTYLALSLSSVPAVRWLVRAMLEIWNGRYGITAALGANIAADDGGPSLGRWAGATLIWEASPCSPPLRRHNVGLKTFHEGYVLSEAVYAGALEHENLRDRGHTVVRELLVLVYYKGRYVARQRLDMVVDNRIIVENKATERLSVADAARPSRSRPRDVSIRQIGGIRVQSRGVIQGRPECGTGRAG